MNLEDDLRNIRPALDRAIDQAADDVLQPARRTRRFGSRARTVMTALAAAAVVAAAVGVATRFDVFGDRGGRVTTLDTSGSSSTALSTTTPTTTAPTSSAPATTTTAAGVALQSVQWSSVAYPIDPHCAGLNPPVLVIQVAYPVPAPGLQFAAVLVRCNVGAGTPPSALYVYDRASSTRSPHLAAALVTDADGWQAGNFSGANPLSVNGASISLAVAGFSSTSQPNCCPDIRATLVWHWTGARYQLDSPVPTHVRNSAFS